MSAWYWVKPVGDPWGQTTRVSGDCQETVGRDLPVRIIRREAQHNWFYLFH
jgi:hypothetical protein